MHDGARLEVAAVPYGLSGERVRQILKEGGVTAENLPGRAGQGQRRRTVPAAELARVIEAMWRERMVCHETRAGGLTESTISAYVSGSSRFVRWLAGEYEPRPSTGGS